MSQAGDYQSHPSIYQNNVEIPNNNAQLHREYFSSFDEQNGQEQSKVSENKSEGFDGTLRLKSISIAVPQYECASLSANLKRIKSSSLGSNSQVLRASGSSRENNSVKLQPPGMISEEDNSAIGSTRQYTYSCISAQIEDQSQDFIDFLPGGAIFDSQFISDDSIKEFCVHLHFQQLMQCNLYRWLSVSASSQNPSEKIKVLEIPVRKRLTHGRKKNSFEAVIMKFKNGSSYAKEIGEKLEGLQKLISLLEVHRQQQKEKQGSQQSEIEQEHLINQQNGNGLTDNSKALFDSKTLQQQHHKSGIPQKSEEILDEDRVNNGDKEGETALHKAADNPKQEFRDMINAAILRHRSKYFSYVLEYKDLRRCQLKKQQPSQHVQKEQSWSSQTSSSCECKSQGCYDSSAVVENYVNESYPEETEMLIGHNEQFLSLVSLDRVHLSSKMIRVKKFCLFQSKISRDKYKGYLLAKIDSEMRNLKEMQGPVGSSHCRSCLESYLELSLEGGTNNSQENKEKGADKHGNTSKKVFKGVEMTTMDDIVFPLDINLIEEENMYFKIAFFQYEIADSNVQKVSQMRAKSQSESDLYEKHGSSSDKLIARKNNKRHSLKISKQSSISRDISMSAVAGGQFETMGKTTLQGQGGGGEGDTQLSSSTHIHRLFEESSDSLHPKNKHYQQNSESFISKYYPKSIMKNNSSNSQAKEDKPAVAAPPLPQNNDTSKSSKSKLNNHAEKFEQYSQQPSEAALSHNDNNVRSELDYEKEKELYLEEQFKFFNPQVEEDEINQQNQSAYAAINLQHMNFHSQQQQSTPSNIVSQEYPPLQQKEQVPHYFNQPTQSVPHTHLLPNSLDQQILQQQQPYPFPARLQQEISPLPLEAAPVTPYQQIVPKINELPNGISPLNEQEDKTQKKESKKIKTPRAKKEPITPKNEKKLTKNKKLENGKETTSLASISTILTQHEPAAAPVLLPQQQQQIQTNEILKPPVATTAAASQYHTDTQLQPQQNALGMDNLQHQIPPQQPAFHQYPDTHSPYLVYSDQPQYSPYFSAQHGYYPQSHQQQQVASSYYPQPPPNYSPNSQQFMTVHGIPQFVAAAAPPPGAQGYSPRIPYSQYSPYGYNNLPQTSYTQPQIVQQQQFQQQQHLHQPLPQHNLNSSPSRNIISPFPQVTPQFPPLDLNAQPNLQSVQTHDHLVEQGKEPHELINEEVPSKKKRIPKPKKAQGAVGAEGDLTGLRISDPQQNQIGSSGRIDQSQLQSKNLEEQDKSPALQKKPKLNRKQSADNNNTNTNVAPEKGDQLEGQQLKKKPGRPQNKKNQIKEEILNKDTFMEQTLKGEMGDTINSQQAAQSEGDAKNLEGQLAKQIEDKQNIEQPQSKWEIYRQEQQFQQQSQHMQQQLYNEVYPNQNPLHSGDNNNIYFHASVSPYSTPYSFGQKLPGMTGQSGAMFTAGSCQNLASNQMIYPPPLEHLQNMHPQQILPFSQEFPVQNPETLQPGYFEKEHPFYQQEP